VALWQFNLHSGFGKTGSPGIICIVRYQDLHHPPECETSSMDKLLLAQVHITKLNEVSETKVIELTSETVDEAALPILKKL
jgi:hypothetical protein